MSRGSDSVRCPFAGVVANDVDGGGGCGCCDNDDDDVNSEEEARDGATAVDFAHFADDVKEEEDGNGRDGGGCCDNNDGTKDVSVVSPRPAKMKKKHAMVPMPGVLNTTTTKKKAVAVVATTTTTRITWTCRRSSMIDAWL